MPPSYSKHEVDTISISFSIPEIFEITQSAMNRVNHSYKVIASSLKHGIQQQNIAMNKVNSKIMATATELYRNSTNPILETKEIHSAFHHKQPLQATSFRSPSPASTSSSPPVCSCSALAMSPFCFHQNHRQRRSSMSMIVIERTDLRNNSTCLSHHHYHQQDLLRRYYHDNNQHGSQRSLNSEKGKIQKSEEKDETWVQSNLTIPNALTMTRIALSPVICNFIYHQNYYTAAILFSITAITDWLDGYIAKNWPSQGSKLGSYLDPLADKVFVGCVAVTMALMGLLPASIVTLMGARDISLVFGTLAIRIKNTPQPKSLKKFFAVQDESVFQIEPTKTGKFNTFGQIVLIGTALMSSILGIETQSKTIITLLSLIVGSTTLASWYQYIQVGLRKWRNMN